MEENVLSWSFGLIVLTCPHMSGKGLGFSSTLHCTCGMQEEHLCRNFQSLHKTLLPVEGTHILFIYSGFTLWLDFFCHTNNKINYIVKSL